MGILWKGAMAASNISRWGLVFFISEFKKGLSVSLFHREPLDSFNNFHSISWLYFIILSACPMFFLKFKLRREEFTFDLVFFLCTDKLVKLENLNSLWRYFLLYSQRKFSKTHYFMMMFFSKLHDWFSSSLQLRSFVLRALKKKIL